MQSQGTQRQTPETQASGEQEQLERSAAMFEMILQTAPDDVQNLLALKDIYRELRRDVDFKRVVKRLAEVYLASGQREEAAREFADILEIDPQDENVASKLRELGYRQADLPLLNVQAHVGELRKKRDHKLQELREAEEALSQATATADAVRKGRNEPNPGLLQAIEEEAERKTLQLIEEHQRWLNEGRAEVFNRVAESLKGEANRIIETNQYGSMNKSTKVAEKILATTDRVFQKEWQRISQEREQEFHEKFENLKREKEAKLHSAWQEVIPQAERDRAAADKSLQKVKAELAELEDKLREEEQLLQESQKLASRAPRPQPPPKGDQPSLATVAPKAAREPGAPPREHRPEPAGTKAVRDEVGKTLGAILVQHGLVTRQHLEEAIAKQEENYRPIGQILVELGYAAEEDIINALVAQAGVPYLPLASYEISDEVAMILPKEVAFKYALMPVDRIGTSLLVAMGIPLNGDQKREIQRHAQGMNMKYFISSWSDIKAKHEQHYA